MSKRDDERRRVREQGEAARRQMQEILDRVEERMREREERNRRGFFRRLFAR
jgi:hypothetical protein